MAGEWPKITTYFKKSPYIPKFCYFLKTLFNNQIKTTKDKLPIQEEKLDKKKGGGALFRKRKRSTLLKKKGERYYSPYWV